MLKPNPLITCKSQVDFRLHLCKNLTVLIMAQITILRNPVNLVWSNVFAFKSQPNPGSEQEVHAVEQWIIEQFDSTDSFNVLSERCSAMNLEWNTLQNRESMNGDQRHNFMVQRSYRGFVAEYLRLKFVAPRTVNDRPRQHIFKWAPLLIPNLLIGLIAFEQELGIYGHFKVVQFEYIYSDTADAMSNIRCWITGSCGADDVEKQHLFETVDRRNSAVPSNTTFTGWFDAEVFMYFHSLFSNQSVKTCFEFLQRFATNQIKRVFGQCTEATIDLVLRDRVDLLIGDWIPWKWDSF